MPQKERTQPTGGKTFAHGQAMQPEYLLEDGATHLFA